MAQTPELLAQASTEAETQRLKFLINLEERSLIFGEASLTFQTGITWEVISIYSRPENKGRGFTQREMYNEVGKPGGLSNLTHTVKYINSRVRECFGLPEDCNFISNVNGRGTPYVANADFEIIDPDNNRPQKSISDNGSKTVEDLANSETPAPTPSKSEREHLKQKLIMFLTKTEGIFRLYLQFTDGTLFSPETSVLINRPELVILGCLTSDSKLRLEELIENAKIHFGETVEEFEIRLKRLDKKVNRLGYTIWQESDSEGNLECGLRAFVKKPQKTPTVEEEKEESGHTRIRQGKYY